MLIFDSFKSFSDAEKFAGAVLALEAQLEIHVCKSQSQPYGGGSNDIDPFPYELVPPIVLVERSGLDDEIEALVERHNGEFAGT